MPFMNKTLLSGFRRFLCLAAILFLGFNAKASHVVGLDLSYKWISGNTYKITLIAYGDCSAASSGSFSTLNYAVPEICIFDGSSYVTSINLHIDTPGTPRYGKEITPVCPADTNHTQCTNTSYSIPGIKKFVYVGTYSVPHTSHNWRFLFNSNMGSASGTGRAASITNLVGAGGTLVSLVDTLDNVTYNNNSPILTIVPTPFFCLNNSDHYSPGAVDADGDSLTFDLVRAGNPSTTTCTATGLATYVGGYSAARPLSTYTGAFNFDPTTGQVSFTPNITQRSVVVYNIREFRNDTFIGSSQREMTFLVLVCTTPPPTGSLTGSTNGTIDDSTHFHICANTGAFDLTLTPVEADTTLNIKVTTTGVPPGCTLTVTNDSTNHASAHISWTSNGTTPGIYTFYVTFSDDNCPLKGEQTLAFTISILPIPTVSYTTIRPSTCSGDAILSITPGGLGSPWTVDLHDITGTTIHTHPGLTGTFTDTVGVGFDTLVVYSSMSTFCNARIPMPITQAPFPNPIITHTSPTYCGANDGVIHLSGLDISEVDTITYNVYGAPAAPVPVLTSGTGTVDLNGLCAGAYTNIVVNLGRCHTSPVSATLTNPGFSILSLTKTDPTSCGVPDGTVKIHGVHPGQADSVFYDFNGVPQSAFVAVAASDSSITIPALLAGVYANFYVTTVGACPGTPFRCVSNTLGPVTLVDPVITANNSFDIHLGCKGDTVFFTNLSTPAGLYSRWYFGDGYTDTVTSPYHIYHHVGAVTINARMMITNTHCVDSTIDVINLPEVVKAIYTPGPDTVCQGTPINFTNASKGVSNQYFWDFGDGLTDNTPSPAHSFAHPGAYTVTLIAKDQVPCFDTLRQKVQIDSNTQITLSASDTVICKGGLVTFTGNYTDIGLTGTEWVFGDGSSTMGANPIQHQFEATGNLTVTLTVKYRTCPTANVTKDVRIYPNPSLYLGPDTSICPGGSIMNIRDEYNATNSHASWLWNTGEITPNITINKPGNYCATVTIYGCIATDSVVVGNDCYADIPNVFTPNGDGVNDYFFPRQYLTKGLTEFSMSIYNRWGQLVYQTSGIEGRGWDGKFNDVPQPQGVFIYKIDARFKDGQILNKQGNVTLVR